MKKLKGCKIEKILISPDQDYLVFETDKGRQAYYADGDCCSRSWFSGITGVDALLGHTVGEIEAVPMSEVDSDPQYDCLKIYGIKLTTDAGRADVEFRNSSNGYYGGSCDPTTLDGLDLSKYASITDDFSGTAMPNGDDE